MRALLASGLLFWLGCGDPPEDPGAITLNAQQHLARASLALRGVRPSVAELRLVASDPAALPVLVDRYLAAPELGATIRELHNEVFRFKLQHWNYTLPGLPPHDALTVNEINGSVFDEPLRLIEDIVINDRPYTQIVTADYTMADPVVAGVYGLPHSGEARWERVVWEDGRGAAGVLSTNAPYLRYRTTFYNFNRGRANAFSRALLCHDFLDGEIHLDTSINVADPEIVNHAITTNPSCVGCHQTLDPLASYFFPFRGGTLAVYAYPMAMYFPDDVGAWNVTNHRAPSYFGRRADDLTELGKAIAADRRFSQCTVRNFASYLLQTSADALPRRFLAELHDALLTEGFRAKALLRAIVLSSRFARAAHRDPKEAERSSGYLKLRPQQLARMIEDLTGYRWQTTSATSWNGRPLGPVDFLDDDIDGFRVLAGGIDSYFVTRPSHAMTATSSLVLQRLAMDAARDAVAREADGGPRRLFSPGDLHSSDEPVVRAQLAHLHARIYSELIDQRDPALDEELALFYGVLDKSGDVRRAWTITVAGMLQDLRAVYY